MAWLRTVEDRAAAGFDASRLEGMAAVLAGSEHCVLCENASDGLAMALGICGAGSGDKVLCSPLAGRHVRLAVHNVNAVPVYVDINPNSLNIDPYCLDYVLRKYKREKTAPPSILIATDQFGLPCNYTSLGEICAENGVTLIEDMGTGFGGKHDGKPMGSFGRFSAASVLDEGESGSDGAVFCRDAGDAEILRVLQEDNGVRQMLYGTAETEPGDGEIQGGHLEKRLTEAADAMQKRRDIAGMYREKLKGHVRFQETGTAESAYTHFAVLTPDKTRREAVMAAFVRERIPCTAVGAAYPGEFDKEGEWARAILANTKLTSKKLLLLPMHQYLTENVVSYICDIMIAELG
ncbi:MAG: DegT/DnrJ/EryC1/StrS family aminotransferase [Oscillospiraceae bacterium]|nr:DegT/DnrJ/EryC1/StrS family aminotransferase [Oscillospiraceae bacterium]